VTPFHLLVLSVAVYRATRLVCRDSISDGVREWLRHRGFRFEIETNPVTRDVTGHRSTERPGRAVSRWLWRLAECSWCTSIWLGALAIGLFLSFPTPTLDVAYVLSCSAVAGILSERVA
jgi:hypothetical protein